MTKISAAETAAFLNDHFSLIAASVEREGGTVDKFTGDGVMATFDGPGRGIACAQEIMEKAGALGLDLRCGLHTGECELRDDEAAGVAVHLASRVSDLAGSGEVLVSRTVRDLVSGSNVAFEDRGEHTLKGFAESWRLFAVS